MPILPKSALRHESDWDCKDRGTSPHPLTSLGCNTRRNFKAEHDRWVCGLPYAATVHSRRVRTGALLMETLMAGCEKSYRDVSLIESLQCCSNSVLTATCMPLCFRHITWRMNGDKIKGGNHQRGWISINKCYQRHLEESRTRQSVKYHKLVIQTKVI